MKLLIKVMDMVRAPYAYSWGLANAMPYYGSHREEICRWHLNGCSLSPAPTIDSVLAASSVYISIGH